MSECQVCHTEIPPGQEYGASTPEYTICADYVACNARLFAAAQREREAAEKAAESSSGDAGGAPQPEGGTQ